MRPARCYAEAQGSPVLEEGFSKDRQSLRKEHPGGYLKETRSRRARTEFWSVWMACISTTDWLSLLLFCLHANEDAGVFSWLRHSVTLPRQSLGDGLLCYSSELLEHSWENIVGEDRICYGGSDLFAGARNFSKHSSEHSLTENSTMKDRIEFLC